MKSSTTDRFWKCYAELPAETRKQAREAYRLFEQDPHHPRLHFKRIHPTKSIFSARVSKNYRSVGIVQSAEIIWFWIGSHAKYNRLVKSMRTL